MPVSRYRRSAGKQGPPLRRTEKSALAAPPGGETRVAWSMSVFTAMDAMIGKDFDKGLANMKAAAEK
jgi:hypothetical protein